VFEDRTLFDMQFDETVDIGASGLRNERRIEAHLSHGTGDRLAAEADGRLRIIGPDAAGDGARTPEIGGGEATRFLFAKRDAFQRALRLAELLLQRLQRNQRRKRAKDAVVAPARGL